jgi:hypothetical protein
MTCRAEKSCLYWDSKSDLTAVQPVASRYTDCAISAPRNKSKPWKARSERHGMQGLAEIGYLPTLTVSSVHRAGWQEYECGVVGEMRLGRETRKKQAPQCYLIRHKSHTIWPGTESAPPWWEAGGLEEKYKVRFNLFSWDSQKETENYEDLDVGRRMILKWI